MDADPRPHSILTGLYIRNLAANLIGNLIIALLNIFTPLDFLKDWMGFLAGGGWALVPLFIFTAAAIVTILQFYIQRPIARYLALRMRAEKAHGALELQARQRLLNLPILLGLTNLAVWLSLNIIVTPVMFVILDMALSSFLYNFFRVLMIGIMASFISFFLIDDFVREKLIPLIGPAGRLSAIPGTVRISILRRIRVLFGVGTNAPMILLWATIAFAVWELDETLVNTAQFSRSILTFSGLVFIVFIIMSLSLNILVLKSILRPINDMIGVVC